MQFLNTQIDHPDTDKKSYILVRNKYGNYEHQETNFVFDKNTKLVYGRQVEDRVIPLSNGDIEKCIELKFNYIVTELPQKEECSDDNESDDENETNKENIEQKYKELLISLFTKRYEDKFKDCIKDNIAHKISFDVYNCNIKNIYGLEFHGIEFVYYKHTDLYSIDFNTYTHCDGIIENELSSDVFSVRYSGNSVKEVFSKAVDNLNKYIFCRHCGNIRKYDMYFTEQEKCECCVINDILSFDKKSSEYCNICMEHTKNYYTLRCGHKFHRACVSKLANKICPTCRKYVNESEEENDIDE